MRLSDYILKHDEINKSKLCEKANISRPTLENLLNGKPKKLSTIQSICEVLGLDWKEYLD